MEILSFCILEVISKPCLVTCSFMYLSWTRNRHGIVPPKVSPTAPTANANSFQYRVSHYRVKSGEQDLPVFTYAHPCFQVFSMIRQRANITNRAWLMFSSQLWLSSWPEQLINPISSLFIFLIPHYILRKILRLCDLKVFSDIGLEYESWKRP